MSNRTTYPGTNLINIELTENGQTLGYVPVSGVRGIFLTTINNLSNTNRKQIIVPPTHPAYGQCVYPICWFHSEGNGTDHKIFSGNIELPLNNNYGYFDGTYFLDTTQIIEIARASNGNTDWIKVFGAPASLLGQEIVIN